MSGQHNKMIKNRCHTENSSPEDKIAYLWNQQQLTEKLEVLIKIES